MDLNLILTVVWLVVGVGILAWQAATGTQAMMIPFGGVSFSGGWVALVLALYNLARWYSRRSYRAAQRQAAEEAEARRRERRAEAPHEPNPNLDFSDRPPS